MQKSGGLGPRWSIVPNKEEEVEEEGEEEDEAVNLMTIV
jgi:hypothetical protein